MKMMLDDDYDYDSMESLLPLLEESNFIPPI